MGIFDWLLQRRAGAGPKTEHRLRPVLNEDIPTLRSPQFCGQSSASDNGRYRLTWSHGAESSSRREVRGRKSGRYLLLQGGVLVMSLQKVALSKSLI
jgi:hypothetical protein